MTSRDTVETNTPNDTASGDTELEAMTEDRNTRTGGGPNATPNQHPTETTHH